jgi:plastocyanin
MKSIRFIIALALLVAGLAVTGALAASSSSSTKAPAAATEVRIDNFSFAPQTVTVSVGTTVHWTNRDDIPHTVASEDKSFRSKALDTDDGFTYTFTKPGTYNYFCSLHPRMTGKVVVQ